MLQPSGGSAAHIDGASVPSTLRSIPRWIIWRWHPRGGEWGKIPATAVSGPDGVSAHDPHNWMTFDQATAELAHIEYNGTWASVGGGGLGFVFDGSDGLGGVDLDGCRDPTTGQLACWARDIVAAFDETYIEISPSGKGLHIYAFGAPERMGRTQIAMQGASGDPVIEGKDAFLEAYVEGRFFTFTGNALSGRSADVIASEAGWAEVMAALGTSGDQPDNPSLTRSYPDPDLDDVRAALSHFTTDDVDRNTFVEIGHVIRHLFDEEGFEVWAEWMARSPCDDPDMTRGIWEGLRGAPRSMTVGTIYRLAELKGWVPPWRSPAARDFEEPPAELDDDDFNEFPLDDEDFKP